MQGKKILLGVTGSIAAYKTPELVRQLIKSGAEVKVILTAAAADFVSPLALGTVSKNKVYQSFLGDDKSSWNNTQRKWRNKINGCRSKNYFYLGTAFN